VRLHRRPVVDGPLLHDLAGCDDVGLHAASRRSGWPAPTASPPPSINPAGPIDWGDLAGGAGYFDQAHFGHEFRAFTGLTPTRYVEVRRRFLREHPGHALDSWPLPAD
jgi:hypothetical protein